MPSRTRTRNFNSLTAALLLVIAAIVGYQARAYRADPLPQQAQPRPIATFDLEKTFNTIDAKKAADADLVRLAEGMKKQTDDKSKRLKQMQADLKDLQPGTAKYKEALENLASATTEDYQVDIEFFKAKINIERAQMMQRLYQDIRAAAKQLATERGYAVVFVNDSIAPIPPGTEDEINRQISARRMVYVAPDIDITDELISRMNNAFKTAGPPPPPGAAAPAPAANAPARKP